MVCLLYCLYEDFTGMFQYFHNLINTWHAVFMAARMERGDGQFVKNRGDKFRNMKRMIYKRGGMRTLGKLPIVYKMPFVYKINIFS